MIILENPHEGWNGTYGILVRTLVQDILSDGLPFEAEVHWEVPSEHRNHATTMRCHVGQISEFREASDRVVFTDGTLVDGEDIRKVIVP